LGKENESMTSLINRENIGNYLNKVVKINDLNSIYDLWMILIRPKNSNLSDDEGILSFVGKETNEESDKLYTPDNIIIPIYNDSIELDGDMFYEE
jgi:hypothetical protein